MGECLPNCKEARRRRGVTTKSDGMWEMGLCRKSPKTGKGSLTPNHGAVKLSSKRGSRHTSRGHVSTHSQAECHGPPNGIVPSRARSYQRSVAYLLAAEKYFRSI